MYDSCDNMLTFTVIAKRKGLQNMKSNKSFAYRGGLWCWWRRLWPWQKQHKRSVPVVLWDTKTDLLTSNICNHLFKNDVLEGLWSRTRGQWNAKGTRVRHITSGRVDVMTGLSRCEVVRKNETGRMRTAAVKAQTSVFRLETLTRINREWRLVFNQV